jgi:hypothetical protein
VKPAPSVAGRNPADFKVNVGSNDYLGGKIIDAVVFVTHPYWGCHRNTAETGRALDH